MKESNLYKSLLAAILTAMLGIPAVSLADARSDLHGVSVKVSYADLNVEKREGARVLYRRLQQASRQACDHQSLLNAGSVQRLAATRKCYENSLESAVEDLDNDLVSLIHNS